MSIEPITIPMTMSSNEVDIPMAIGTEVNVHSGGGGSLQAKTNINPTTSSQTITADAGYDGLSSVQINAMPSGSATTPATSITANPSISVNSSTGVITASVSKTQSVTPTVSAGYVASGTAGTVTVSGSNTSNLTTQGAQTIHPSSSDQTIASGKYLTGAQTIKGVTVTNLTAENIKKDVVVEIGDSTDSDCVTSVTGSYEGGGGGAEDELLDGTLTGSYSNSRITKVRSYAFTGSGVTSIDLENVTEILARGLQDFTTMTSCSLPKVTRVSYYGFSGCTGLTSLHLPSLVDTGSETGNNGGYAFIKNSNIVTYVFPSFSGKLHVRDFQNNTALKTIDLNSFQLNAMSGGANYLMTGDSNFDTFIIRSTTLVPLTMAPVWFFNGTKFASGGAGGTIYIPKVLYDHLGDGTSSDYKSATNWSTLDGYGTVTWAKIEGSQYENYYADGTPITT